MAQKDQLFLLKMKDSEVEKTAFEKFEHELKNTIFGITFLMLKTEYESFWQLVSILIIQAFQLLSLVFNPAINFPWKGYTVSLYFQSFVQVFQVAYWCKFADWVSYLLTFYTAIFVVALVVIIIIYAVYTFANKKITVMWPIRLLRQTLNSLVTVLFMPYVYLLLSMVQCTTQNGELIHSVFSSVKCWKELHILHSIFGLIACFVFVVITFVVVLTLFETKSISNDPSARVHSRNEFYQNGFKLICIILETFFAQDEYRYILTLFMLIGSVFLYIKAKNEKPYYQETINKINDVINGLFMWSCFCLLIVMINENTNFAGGMQAFIMGLPLVAVIIITRVSRRTTLLLKAIEDIDNPEEWYLKIRYYISIVQHREVSREDAVQLNGFIFHHEEGCKNSSCPIKAYTTTLLAGLKDKKKKQSKSSMESFTQLMNYAKQLFSQGVAKFPNCSSLHIAFALFLKDRANDKTTAISELTSAERSNPQFDQQFFVYRYRKILEDESTDINDGGGAGLDVVAMLAYENYLQQCKEAIEKSSYLHMEFWLELLESEPDLGKLDATGIKINVVLTVVQDYWEKLQKINPNVPKALKLYAEYLVEILNDLEEGTELMAKAREGEIIRNNYILNAVGDAAALGMGDICATMGGADGTPCIVASGDQVKLGEIIQFNMSMCKLFGYTKEQLAGKKINMLMPEVYSKNHDSILQHGIENVETMGLTSSKSEKFVLGRHKSGYLLPLPLQVRTVISVKQGAFFVATFKYDKKGLNVTYLLVDEHQDIIGMSSKAIESLKLTNTLLKNYRVSIVTLIPGILDKTTHSNCMTKNGAIVDVFTPDSQQEHEINMNGSFIIKGSGRDLNSGQIDSQSKKLRARASKMSIRMNCIMIEIAYGGHTNGFVLRLEPVDEIKIPVGSLKIDKTSTNFQFVFDPVDMKYTQQNCDDDAQKLISEEMSQYVNIMRDRSPSSFTPNKSDESKDRMNTSMISAVPEASKMDDISRIQAALDAKKKEYAEGIETYRLINGERKRVNVVKSRLLERQQEEQKELEEAQTKEVRTANKRDDAFSVLKSRKTLSEALNEKIIPSSVQKLKYAGYVIVLVLLVLASTEFGLTTVQYKDIGENIQLIKSSYRQIVTQMRMVFYINKMVLFQKADKPKLILKDSSDFIECKNKVNKALNEYYEMQNIISLSTISLSDPHNALFRTKNVFLYYYNTTRDNSKDANYTLTEAIQQMASEVFTASSYTDYTKYSVTNDNIYFVLYNGFADLYSKMQSSANYFVIELSNRGTDKIQVILILFIVSVSVLVISMGVLFPIVAGVAKTRLNVLMLFFDIPQATVKELQRKCEKFVAQNKEEDIEGLSASESNAGIEDVTAKIEGSVATSSSTTSHSRKYKNNKSSNATFYLVFIITVLLIAGYFAVNFSFGYVYLKNVSGYSRELNATASAHSETTHAISAFQGLLGYENILIYSNSGTFDFLALKEITDLYAIAQEMQVAHNEYVKIFTDSYQNAFIDIMRNNICNYKAQFNLTVNCDTFLEGTIKEGLHPVFINFIETTREMLTNYRLIMSSKGNRNDIISTTLLNSAQFSDMEKSIFDVVDVSLRYLVDKLVNSYDAKYNNEMLQRIILLICFLLCFLIGYISLWSPFTDQLSNEIWRTKSMLALIPFDICKNIPSIKEYLNKQHGQPVKVKE